MKTKTVLSSILLTILITRTSAQICETGSLAPNPDNCNSFLQCLYGKFVVMPCPEGLHWNKLSQICDYPANANCQEEHEEITESGEPAEEPATVEEGPEAGDSCEIGSYAPNPVNCNSFLQCVHGKFKVISCSTGLHWNKLAQTCDYPANAHCQERPVKPTEIPTEEPVEPTDEAETEEPVKPTEDPGTEGPVEPTEEPATVEEGPEAGDSCEIGSYAPNPVNCNSFLQCVHGKFKVMPCPTGLHWNKLAQTCDYPANAHCQERPVKPTEIPTEEPAEPTDEPETEEPVKPTEDPGTEGPIEPTEQPTEEPGTEEPVEPSEQPTDEPGTEEPIEPTEQPTEEPATEDPTEAPIEPSTEEPIEPTEQSTENPGTEEPTEAPIEPSEEPSTEGSGEQPTEEPDTEEPVEPTEQPTEEPGTEEPVEPTEQPTDEPTEPTEEPATEAPVPVCECGETFHDPTDCSSFFKCVEHQWTHETCTYGLHFNQVTQLCDWPEQAQCPFNCECGDEISTYKTCDTYYKCVDHRFVLHHCSPGLHWNSLTMECDWPERVQCAWDNNLGEKTTEAQTDAPTTEDVKTTEAQTEPTTEPPTTAAPTTAAPTTVAPTSEAPTTAAPTTSAPTTAAPTTAAPTTAAPTTAAPTTTAPTTTVPTTTTTEEITTEDYDYDDEITPPDWWGRKIEIHPRFKYIER